MIMAVLIVSLLVSCGLVCALGIAAFLDVAFELPQEHSRKSVGRFEFDSTWQQDTSERPRKTKAPSPVEVA